MTASVDGLTFDPSALPATHRISSDDQEFFEWFDEKEAHYEFEPLVRRLKAASAKSPDPFDFEWNILWHTWRASTWKARTPDDGVPPWLQVNMEAIRTSVRLASLADAIDAAGEDGARFSLLGIGSTETRKLAKRLRAQVEATSRLLLVNYQHGPFLYRDGIQSRTQLPSAATLLAAQLHLVFKQLRIPPDWVLLALLVSVGGINEHIGPESLSASARRLAKDVERGAIVLVGWPQDVGLDLSAVEQSINRFRSPA